MCLKLGSSRLGWFFHLEFTTVDDGDGLGRLARVGAESLDGLDDVHTLNDFTEDDVPAVEPAGDDGGDEELAAVGVLASVGHGEDSGACVTELEVLISKLGAIDGLAASAVAICEITTLDHEVGDNTMEGAALVVQRLARLAHALLTSAESAEVLNGLRNSLAIEAHHDAAELLTVSLDVKIDVIRDLRATLGSAVSGTCDDSHNGNRKEHKQCGLCHLLQKKKKKKSQSLTEK